MTDEPFITDSNNSVIKSVKNLQWRNVEHTLLSCTVDLEGAGIIPFATAAHETTPYGQEIWQKAVAGEYGSISEYVAPSAEQKRLIMPDLERWRVNTIIDLEPGLREKINAAIEDMEEPKRTISKNKLADVQMFSRTDTLFDLIGAMPSIGKTPEDIDAMWEAAINLT
ncbi:hypothetical protein ABE530_19165 [Brucella sp. TWI559]